MNNSLKWFAKTNDAFEPVEVVQDDSEENRLDADDLPPHVQEFLAMKAAAGF